ncbi:hypothetical protein [Lancefieldella rimae]|uniref:hypothetical protein n=1 Tax=Lancefieldella rimae TaxID=1383 RepID=UPI0028EDC34B|nr:hypothetical protein [Lancefieldella rimae]
MYIKVKFDAPGFHHEEEFVALVSWQEVEEVADICDMFAAEELDDHVFYSPMECMSIFEFLPPDHAAERFFYKGHFFDGEHPDKTGGALVICFPVKQVWGIELMITLGRCETMELAGYIRHALGERC